MRGGVLRHVYDKTIRDIGVLRFPNICTNGMVYEMMAAHEI
jgi:hypothetical protein